jgi:hypothetical protein
MTNCKVDGWFAAAHVFELGEYGPCACGRYASVREFEFSRGESLLPPGSWSTWRRGIWG